MAKAATLRADSDRTIKEQVAQNQRATCSTSTILRATALVVALLGIGTGLSLHCFCGYALDSALTLSCLAGGASIALLTLVSFAISCCRQGDPQPVDPPKEKPESTKPEGVSPKRVKKAEGWQELLQAAKKGKSEIQDWQPLFAYLSQDPKRALELPVGKIIFRAIRQGDLEAVREIVRIQPACKQLTDPEGDSRGSTPYEYAKDLSKNARFIPRTMGPDRWADIAKELQP